MSAALRRRWFQFGLGTLFAVMTVIAAFFGYHVKWIQQRHSFYSRSDVEVWRPVIRSDLHGPGLLWLFGEPGQQQVWFTSDRTPEKAVWDRAKELFPEAIIRQVSPEEMRQIEASMTPLTP